MWQKTFPFKSKKIQHVTRVTIYSQKTYLEIAENFRESIFNGIRFTQSSKLAHTIENFVPDKDFSPENLPKFRE